LAGIIGIDPGPFTLRQLVWMAEGRRDFFWEHTAHVLCYLYNAHRSPKSPALMPADFHPFADKRKRRMKKRLPQVGIEALKVFVPKSTRGNHGNAR